MNKIAILITTMMLLTQRVNAQICTSCDEAQAEMDSMNLYSIYQAMNGGEWETQWDINEPIETWFGVQTSLDGCVLCIDLDGHVIDSGSSLCYCSVFSQAFTNGNNLSGTWSEEISLPCLQALSLSYNAINDSIPNFQASSPDLCQLVLKSTGLTGPIIMNHLELPNLTFLHLGVNELSGSIPEAFLTSFINIEKLFLAENNLTGTIPNFSLLPNLQILRLNDNKFTFEDFLPHFTAIKNSIPNFTYESQDSVYVDTIFTVGEGLPFTIDLEIDENVTSSLYRWNHNDNPIGNTMTNKLFFDSLTDANIGVYNCNIINGLVQGLTLYCRNIEIQLCTPEKEYIDTTLCPGEQVMRGDLSFDRDTIHILRGAATNGCDSAYIAQINFFETTIVDIDTLICADTNFNIGENIFSTAGNYTTILTDRNGCDSTINLTIDFVDTNWGLADLGEDRIVCEPEVDIMANLPDNTFGQWRLPTDVEIENNTSSLGLISQLLAGENEIGWVLGAGGCEAYDSTFIEIYYQPRPITLNDTFHLFDGLSIPLDTTASLIANDTISEFIENFWKIELLENTTMRGQIEVDEMGFFTYIREQDFRGIDSINYLLNTNECPDGDTAKVIFEIEAQYYDLDIPPNMISPNGDGFNDTFVIPLIHRNRSEYPNSQLRIYDQYKNLLFLQNNYLNNWEGTDFNGNQLPEAVYRFVIEYGNGDSHQGDLTLFR